MRTRTSLLLLLAAIGCTPARPRPVSPYVHLVMLDQSHALPIYAGAAGRAWGPLGFDVSFTSSGRVECDRHWYTQTPSPTCQITIGISRDKALRATSGTNALSSRDDRTLAIDTSVTDEMELAVAIAHEVGHILLDTAEHTLGGIMGGSTDALQAVDKALACRTIHRCI